MKMKKVLATAMAAALVVSAVPNTAKAEDTIEWGKDGGQQVVTGEGAVTQPTIEVNLPGDLAFAIDPYMIDSKDKQIVAGDYNVVNLGNVDVTVSVKAGLVLGTGVTAAQNPGLPTEAELNAHTATANTYKDITGTGKKVYLTLDFADLETSPSLVDSNEDGVYEFKYDSDNVNVGRAKTVTSHDVTTVGAAATGTLPQNAYKTTVLAAVPGDAANTPEAGTFWLENPKSNNALDDDGNFKADAAGAYKSVGSFTFGGAVAAHSNLEDGDVQVQAIYTLNVKTANDKAARDGAENNALDDLSNVKLSMLVDPAKNILD